MTAPAIAPPRLLIADDAYRTPEWFAARRDGITATDIAKIAGLHPYGSAYEVWLDKIGDPLPDTAGEAAEIGVLLEPVVAAEWARREGRSVVPAGLYANGERPWMQATPDRLVLGENGTFVPYQGGRGTVALVEGPLEVKTALGWASLDWSDDGQVPDQHQAQVQWQIAVLGADRGWITCLAGPEIKSYEVPRDQGYIDDLIVIAEQFREMVANRVAPAPDGSDRLASLLSTRWTPDPDRIAVLDPAVFRPLQQTYWAAHLELEAVKAKKVAAGNAVRVLMGDAEAAQIDGETVATWKAGKSGSRTLNIKKAKS